MSRVATITISKETLGWSDFEVVGADDIEDGDAQAGARISVSWSQTGNALTADIQVQHTAIVESGKAHTDALLRHEQGHLDLGILGARRIKVDIEAGTSPDNARVQHIARLAAANIRYDTETNHSANTSAQGTWNIALTAALAMTVPPAAVNGVTL